MEDAREHFDSVIDFDEFQKEYNKVYRDPIKDESDRAGKRLIDYEKLMR